eukprot:scaffold376_cov454-Pavlova_lutheri.AAC.11
MPSFALSSGLWNFLDALDEVLNVGELALMHAKSDPFEGNPEEVALGSSQSDVMILGGLEEFF